LGLSDIQLEFCRLFRSLPSSSGFILVGGAGLLLTGVSERPTKDLDFVTAATHADLFTTVDELRSLIVSKGWAMREIQIDQSFCRLEIVGRESMILDLSVDSGPILGTVVTPAGACLHPLELAGRKLTALYSRAEARDFVDVYVTSKIYGFDALLRLARLIDSGFSEHRLVEMLESLDRFDDAELSADPAVAGEIRHFFTMLRTTLGL